MTAGNAYISDLAWVMRCPIPCSNCRHETAELIIHLVDLTEITCPNCGAVLDLNTKEWATFRDSLRKFHVGKKAPAASVKKAR